MTPFHPESRFTHTREGSRAQDSVDARERVKRVRGRSIEQFRADLMDHFARYRDTSSGASRDQN